jgi:hypothetical protein
VRYSPFRALCRGVSDECSGHTYPIFPEYASGPRKRSHHPLGTGHFWFDRLVTATFRRPTELCKRDNLPKMGVSQKILEVLRAYSTLFLHKEKSFQDLWRGDRIFCGLGYILGRYVATGAALSAPRRRAPNRQGARLVAVIEATFRRGGSDWLSILWVPETLSPPPPSSPWRRSARCPPHR